MQFSHNVPTAEMPHRASFGMEPAMYLHDKLQVVLFIFTTHVLLLVIQLDAPV